MLATDTYPGAIFGLHLAEVARAHRMQAQIAQSHNERFHYTTEALWFEHLAELAKTDPQRARREYRPARAFVPGAPIVRYDGAIMSIQRAVAEVARHYNRDDVVTAYLLLLDRPELSREANGAVRDALIEHGLDEREAVRCVLAATLLLSYDIEP